MKWQLTFAWAAFLFVASLANPLRSQEKASDAKSTLAIPSKGDGLAGAGPIRRYDWFQKLWVERRTKWEKEANEKKGALVFLGDSITQGWGEEMSGVFGKTLVANRGISGDTTRGMLLRLNKDVLELNPSGIVLLMGTNDLEEKAEPATIADNVQLLVQQLKKHNSEMPIVMCLVFPSSETKSRPADKIKEINQCTRCTI